MISNDQARDAFKMTTAAFIGGSVSGVSEASTPAGWLVAFVSLTVAYLGVVFAFWLIDEWTIPKEEEDEEPPQVAS